jgi:hypothetical protein
VEWSFVEGGGEHLGEGDLIIRQHGVFGARYVRTFCSGLRLGEVRENGSYGVPGSYSPDLTPSRRAKC